MYRVEAGEEFSFIDGNGEKVTIKAVLDDIVKGGVCETCCLLHQPMCDKMDCYDRNNDGVYFKLKQQK